MDAVRRPACRPGHRPRPLTVRQLRKRLEGLQDEIAALGGAYDQSAGQIRRRLLLLERHIEDTLERWPPA